MIEPMQVRVEVWPVTADEEGVWLASGADAWRATLPVPADGDVHAEVEHILHEHGAFDDKVLLHSTSWRPHGPAIMLTYVAVLRRPGFARENWPAAEPISPRLAKTIGPPLAHGPTEVPIPDHAHVLLHGLRHLAFLRDTDATASSVLDQHWVKHLADLRPALAGMYDEACVDALPNEEEDSRKGGGVAEAA